MNVQALIAGGFDPSCKVFVASRKCEEPGSEDEAVSVTIGWCHGGSFYRTANDFDAVLSGFKGTQARLLKDYGIKLKDWDNTTLEPAILITANA